MLIYENTIIDDDVFETFFCCNLKKCLGNCCIEGDEGAPLTENDIFEIEENIEEIKEFMLPEGKKLIEKVGIIDFDTEGKYVTPLLENGACVFVFYENGIAYCAIEKAYLQGKINFIKPISCHLYPLRLEENNGFIHIKYHRWHICNSAKSEGRAKGITIFDFLEKPLVRNFGNLWYREVKKLSKKKYNNK